MLEEVKNTVFTDFFYDEKQSFFLVVRKKETQKMTNAEYKEDSLLWKDLLVKFKPQKQLVNDINMEYIISLECQQWANENFIAPGIKAGLKAVAFVESVEVFSRVSINQAMDDNILPIKVKYFDDVEKAKKWLGVR